MKALLIPLFITSLLIASSCHKCKVCDCHFQNGMVSEEQCAGGLSANKDIEAWEDEFKSSCPDAECGMSK